jgi:hypothetical protein
MLFNIFEDIDKEELSTLIPDFVKQGITYDEVKLAATEEAKANIILPEVNESLVNEMANFFSDLQTKLENVEATIEPKMMEEEEKE